MVPAAADVRRVPTGRAAASSSPPRRSPAVAPPGPVSIAPIRFLNGSSLMRYVHVDDGALSPVPLRSSAPPATRTCASAARTASSIASSIRSKRPNRFAREVGQRILAAQIAPGECPRAGRAQRPRWSRHARSMQASVTTRSASADRVLPDRRDERRAALGLALPDVRGKSSPRRIACRRSMSRRCCSSTTAA